MISDNRKGILFMVAASVCWSFGGLCIKLIPWGAMSIIGLRALLGAFVLAAYQKRVKVNIKVNSVENGIGRAENANASTHFSAKDETDLKRIHYTTGNISAALSLSATTILFVFATKLTTAAAAILLQFSAPVFIILLHLIFYKNKPKPSEAIAVFVTMLGMLLFFFDGLEGSALLGNILGICSGLSFAGVFVCNKRPDTQPEQAVFLGLVINAAIGIPFVFFEVTADPLAWVAVLFLGIIQIGLAYVFFSAGIKKTPVLLACLITALEPLLNPVWVALVMKEVPGLYTVFGGIIIVASVAGYNVWVEKQAAR